MGKPGEDLANKFALGVNRFPYDLPNATNMIINYKNYVNNPHHTGNKQKQLKKYSERESDDKVSLIQIEYNNVNCYCCGKMGHISPKFPNKIK